ncbi:MAG: hypothetical protein RSD54_08060, partial [Ruthenibacterium sp.]
MQRCLQRDKAEENATATPLAEQFNFQIAAVGNGLDRSAGFPPNWRHRHKICMLSRAIFKLSYSTCGLRIKMQLRTANRP